MNLIEMFNPQGQPVEIPDLGRHTVPSWALVATRLSDG